MEFNVFLVVILISLPICYFANVLIAKWCLSQRKRFYPYFQGAGAVYHGMWFLFDMTLCIAFNIKVVELVMMAVEK